jgi:hypothetical protein
MRPRSDVDQPLDLQEAQGFAQRGTAHREAFDERRLGGQAVPLDQALVADVADDLGGHQRRGLDATEGTAARARDGAVAACCLSHAWRTSNSPHPDQ